MIGRRHVLVSLGAAALSVPVNLFAQAKRKRPPDTVLTVG